MRVLCTFYGAAAICGTLVGISCQTMLQPNPMGPLCRSYGLIRNFRPWLPLATPSFKFPPREFRFPPHFVTELRSQAEKNSSNRPVNPDRDRSKSKRKVGLYVGECLR